MICLAGAVCVFAGIALKEGNRDNESGFLILKWFRKLV